MAGVADMRLEIRFIQSDFIGVSIKNPHPSKITKGGAAVSVTHFLDSLFFLPLPWGRRDCRRILSGCIGFCD
jgi:hypothetical protein